MLYLSYMKLKNEDLELIVASLSIFAGCVAPERWDKNDRRQPEFKRDYKAALKLAKQIEKYLKTSKNREVQ